MERGDLAEFVKKRITDLDFPPPPHCMWAESNNCFTEIRFDSLPTISSGSTDVQKCIWL